MLKLFCYLSERENYVISLPTHDLGIKVLVQSGGLLTNASQCLVH